MKNKFLKGLVSFFALVVSGLANAGLIFYTSDPANNSTNWTNDVVNSGYQINSNVDFDAHPLGALNSNFYLLSDGISISSTGLDNQTVKNGVGDFQGSQDNLVTGEGVHAQSNYLDINNSGVLTLNFTDGAYAAGIMTFDVWTRGDFTINVFSETNGNGSLLGSVSGVAEGQNFQNFRQFFMGVRTDNLTTFGSVQFSFTDDGGDDIGYDDIVFASKISEVPEPSTLAVFALGLMGLASRKFKKQA